MCFFPFKNNRIDGVAYKKGVREFECGACPECLSKKSKQWALRCSMQAQVQKCCMVTLTYDTYIHDTVTGRILGERVSDLKVCKKDAQKFIKRLRIYFKRKKNVDNIKYLLTAEYGKRTHRAHYHAILFGVEFDDLVRYKKSKRGNWINKSATLDKIWSHGICTVDTVCVNAKIARYCTKYCAKDSRADDTFMLFSRGIGQEELLRQFNGLSYIVDGREYPIPRTVWRDYIEKKYNIQGYSRYIGFDKPRQKLRNLYYKTRASERNGIKRYNDLDKKIRSIDCELRRLFDGRKEIDENHPYFWQCWELGDKANSYEREQKDILKKNAVLRVKSTAIKRQFLSKKPVMHKRFTNERDVFNAIHVFMGGDCLRYVFSYGKSSDIGNICERARYRYAYKKAMFVHYRDNDTVYKRYLKYWQDKSALLELGRSDIRTRILQLPNAKYFSYKNAALIALNKREEWRKDGLDSDAACIPPRSNCVSAYYRGLHLPICPPCYKSANDTTEKRKQVLRRLKLSLPRKLSPTDPWADGQISIFD